MTSIYKYFGNKNWGNSFIENGEIYFNSLSYFISCEDQSRRDDDEDAHILRREEGLQINVLTTGKTFTYNGQLCSKIRKADRIYVFCASAEFNENLYQKFNSQVCVEIYDLEEFKRRLQFKITEAHKQGLLGSDQLLSGPVDYYSYGDGPGAAHACPDQIVMGKSDKYKEENEYRFAFSLDKGAFAVNNVDYTLSRNSVPTSGNPSHRVLRLGSLIDICKMAVL